MATSIRVELNLVVNEINGVLPNFILLKFNTYTSTSDLQPSTAIPNQLLGKSV